MPMNDTTSATSAHTVLTDLLGDIKEVTMELPLMEPMNKTEAAVVMSQNFAKSVQPSYEDLVGIIEKYYLVVFITHRHSWSYRLLPQSLIKPLRMGRNYGEKRILP